MKRLISTSAPAAVLLIRLMVGAVFVSEGIQKFLFPAGSGRRPICENRYSFAGIRRAIRRLFRDCLRGSGASWTTDPPRGDSAHYCYAHRDRYYENPNSYERWILENGPRRSDRLVDAARPDRFC